MFHEIWRNPFWQWLNLMAPSVAESPLVTTQARITPFLIPNCDPLRVI